jgi:AbrB family looped-hinge helix DNA binding protein
MKPMILSKRFEVTIPKQVRESLKLRVGQQFQIENAGLRIILIPQADKNPERLKRLKVLNERVRGKFKYFMTQEYLRKMREDDKWAAFEAKTK